MLALYFALSMFVFLMCFAASWFVEDWRMTIGSAFMLFLGGYGIISWAQQNLG